MPNIYIYNFELTSSARDQQNLKSCFETMFGGNWQFLDENTLIGITHNICKEDCEKFELEKYVKEPVKFQPTKVYPSTIEVKLVDKRPNQSSGSSFGTEKSTYHISFPYNIESKSDKELWEEIKDKVNFRYHGIGRPNGGKRLDENTLEFIPYMGSMD